jgi:hypothetical protein
MSIINAEDRPDAARWATEKTVLRCVDVWTTFNGSWESLGLQFGVPQWAVTDYLKPQSDPRYIQAGGADRHFLASRQGPNRELLPGAGMYFGSDGITAANLADENKWAKVNCGPDGWCNVIFYPSAIYYPDQGQQGPFAAFPYGFSDILVGGGMPYARHVAFYGVWQEFSREAEPPPTDPPDDLGAAILAELQGIRADLRLIYRIA